MPSLPLPDTGVSSGFLRWLQGKCGACYRHLMSVIPRPSLPVRAQNKPFPRYIADRLLNLILAYPTDTWEFASALLAMAWGGWIIAFPELLNLHVYSGFAESLDFLSVIGLSANAVMGGAVLIAGLHGFLALFVARLDPFRVYASLFLMCVWASVCTGFFISDLQVISPDVAALEAVRIGMDAARSGLAFDVAVKDAVSVIERTAFHTEGWRLTTTPVYLLFALLSGITFLRLFYARRHKLSEESATPAGPDA